MARYLSTQSNSKIASVEFSPATEQQLTFIHLRQPSDAAIVSQWLSAPPAEQTVIAQNGNVLALSGKQPPSELLKILASHGEILQEPEPKKATFNPWAWRGYTSILGQSLQIASSYTTRGTMADRVAIFGFAALNLTANFINIVFGAQKKDDPHQLHYLKQQFNAQLQPHLRPDETLLDPQDKALKETPHPTIHTLLKKYSVSFGEIGLRTIGSASLAFPVTNMPSVYRTLRDTRSISAAFKAAKNPNPATFAVGLLMLTGKFTSLASKESDPYNPKPPSWLDTIREKITFRASSVIEASAATYMAYDRRYHQKNKWGQPDYLGFAGNAVFVGGYGVRLFAPYGSREVNMPELYAHIADGLSKVPHEQLPQLMLNTAMQLEAHFKNMPVDKNNPLDLASIYTQLEAALHRYPANHLRQSTAPATVTAMAADTPLSSISGTKTRSMAMDVHHPFTQPPALAH